MTFRRKFAIITILTLVAMTAIFGVLEGGARLVGVRAGRRRDFDPERGWVYVPNTVFQFYTTQGRVHASVDDEGFRPTIAAAEDAGAPAIVVLGDSYTFCGESPDDRTWPEFMSRELARQGFPCCSVNRAVTGYSSMQSLVALRHELRRSGGVSRPRAVLYMFCLNDPPENFEPDRPHLKRADFSGPPASPESRNPKEFPPAGPPPRTLRLILRDIRSRSAFINGIKDGPAEASPAGFAAGAATYADLYGPRCREFLETPCFQEGIRYILRELRKECESRGASLFVSSCITPAWDAPGESRRDFCAMVNWTEEKMNAQVAAYHGALDLLGKMAGEAGATYIDVRGALDGMKYREYSAAPDDWHFSAAANERIGKAVADRLFPHLAGSSAGTR